MFDDVKVEVSKMLGHPIYNLKDDRIIKKYCWTLYGVNNGEDMQISLIGVVDPDERFNLDSENEAREAGESKLKELIDKGVIKLNQGKVT